MYYLKTESSFDSAHFLANYEGKCKNIHGHHWRVIAEIKNTSLKENGNEKGMLIDFSVLKKILKQLCDDLDHCLIYEKNSLKPETVNAFNRENFKIVEVPFRPTAENFAKYFYDKMNQFNLKVNRIEVYETPTNVAIYEGEI